MQAVMEKHFNEQVCEQLFGKKSNMWENYIGCCNRDMKHFYNMTGGTYRDKLNAWAVEIMLNDVTINDMSDSPNDPMQH